MNLSLQELKSYYPANNRVILKAAVDTTKQGSLHIIQWDAFKSQPVVCTVISAPRKLTFGKHKVFHESVEELDITPQQKAYLYQIRREAKYTETTMIDAPVPGSMMWKTTIQIKATDIVWVNSNHLLNAEAQGNTITCEDTLYYILPYEALYLKKDGDLVTPLNGYILIDMIQDDPQWFERAEKAGIIIPDRLRGIKSDDRYGIVKYAGKPTEYLLNDRYDHPQVKVGDVVMMRYKRNPRLEPGMKFFAKDSDLVVSRRTNIMSIME